MSLALLSANSQPTILKGSQNRQKTVLPLPVCFGIMDINQKASTRLLRADGRIEGKNRESDSNRDDCGVQHHR